MLKIKHMYIHPGIVSAHGAKLNVFPFHKIASGTTKQQVELEIILMERLLVQEIWEVAFVGESWPLWLTCILAGLISGPFMAQFLVPICYESLDFSLSYEAAYVILAIVGGISGAVIAHYGQESYQKSI